MTDKELDELLPKAMAQLDDEKANVSKPENKRILLTKLTDANTDMRFSAATYLTWVSSDPEVQKALLERCNDTKEDQHVRAKAGTILTNHLDNEPIRKAMLELLKDSDWYVSDNIAEYLEHHAENYPDVANALQAKKAADENFLQEFEKEGKNSTVQPVKDIDRPQKPKRSQLLSWKTGVGGAVAIALIIAIISALWPRPKTQPTPDNPDNNNIVENPKPEQKDPKKEYDPESPTNIFVGSPKDDLTIPKEIKVLAGEDYRMRGIDKGVIYSVAHPRPLKYQGLLHIANSAQLVATAPKGQKLTYELKQLNDKWEEFELQRLEYLVIVTSDKIPEGWPEQLVSPIDVSDLFTKDDIKNLQNAFYKGKEQHKQESLEIVTKALERKFADSPFRIRVTFYASEKPN